MSQAAFVSAASGGALIGLAAVLLMLFNGRIAGISGIFAGLLAPLRGEKLTDTGWRVAFLAGLILSPLLFMAFAGERPTIEFARSAPVMAIGGLLVGYGVRLGSGCTSGHGVCGVARLSKRSVAATATFMTTAIVTVFAMRLMGA